MNEINEKRVQEIKENILNLSKKLADFLNNENYTELEILITLEFFYNATKTSVRNNYGEEMLKDIQYFKDVYLKNFDVTFEMEGGDKK